MASQSRLTDEEFDALDQAAWNALGGKCACVGIDQVCARDEAQQDLLAWAMGQTFESGESMIERWKVSRSFRCEFPYLFEAKWGEERP
jgi:hypothetical protein